MTTPQTIEAAAAAVSAALGYAGTGSSNDLPWHVLARVGAMTVGQRIVYAEHEVRASPDHRTVTGGIVVLTEKTAVRVGMVVSPVSPVSPVSNDPDRGPLGTVHVDVWSRRRLTYLALPAELASDDRHWALQTSGWPQPATLDLHYDPSGVIRLHSNRATTGSLDELLPTLFDDLNAA